MSSNLNLCLERLTQALSAHNVRVSAFINSLEGREHSAALPQMNDRPGGERADANRRRGEGEG